MRSNNEKFLNILIVRKERRQQNESVNNNNNIDNNNLKEMQYMCGLNSSSCSHEPVTVSVDTKYDIQLWYKYTKVRRVSSVTKIFV